MTWVTKLRFLRQQIRCDNFPPDPSLLQLPLSQPLSINSLFLCRTGPGNERSGFARSASQVNPAAPPKARVDAGLFEKLPGPVRMKFTGQRSKLVVGMECSLPGSRGKDAGTRPGSLFSRLSAVDKAHFLAEFCQIPSEGQADDTTAEDEDVGDCY